jgi:NTE family protein
MAPRIGLVLGGGGIVGMGYHGAVLAAVHEATGWDPRDAEIVVGTSAGAASGSELRSGLSGRDLAARRSDEPFTPEGEALLRRRGPAPVVRPELVEQDVERSRAAYRRLLTKSMMLPGSVRPGVLISTAMSPGTLSLEWLIELHRWLHGGARPVDRLWTVAIDLDRGRRVVFGRRGDPVAEVGAAVASSCAIPGVSTPIEVAGRLYIDGGGYSPTNADVLVGRGLDLVLVSAPMSLHPQGRVDRRDRAMRLACRRLLMNEVAQLRAGGTDVVIFEPGVQDLRVMGGLLGDAVLDERRCGPVVRTVHATALAQAEREGLAARLHGRRRRAA